MTFLFADRAEAGQILAKHLTARMSTLSATNTVVLALPRGGVPVAAEIAVMIDAPMDLIMVRKIGVPGHEELAIGAVVDGTHPEIVVNTDVAHQFGLSAEAVRNMSTSGLCEIERRRALYLEGRAPVSLKGKTAVIVDDGIATGASIKAALKAVARRLPARIILAIPVAPANTLAELRNDTVDIICPETPSPFYAVGAHYKDFPQVYDAAVIKALQRTGLPASPPSAP